MTAGLEPAGLAQRLAGALAPTLLTALGRSWRVRVIAEEHLEAAIAAARPAVIVFWHDSAFALANFLRALDGRGLRLSILASRSGDGELVARLGAAWGVDIVRGSSSRGGRAAILALHRRMRKVGTSPALAPDGPRGPRHEFKPGALALAQLAGAAILPLAAAARPAWRLGSWDRQVLPAPFARLTVVAGAPRPIPRDLAGEALEGERRRLERLLLDLNELAAANL